MSAASARPKHSSTGNSTASSGAKWGDDARERIFHLQHILVGVAAMMAMAMTGIVVVDTLVVAVAVGIVGVQMAGVLVGSHNAASVGGGRWASSVNPDNPNRFQVNSAVILNN